MKISERGQVTVPKKLRDRFGLKSSTPVEFAVEADKLVLKKIPKPLRLEKWKGKCKGSLEKMGYRAIDDYIRDVRGR